MYRQERSAVKIVTITSFVVMIVLGFSFIGHYYASLDERFRPAEYIPLLVGFSVPNGDGTFQRVNVGVEEDKVASFSLPPNTHTQFTYIITSKTAEPQQNVTLSFDSVSQELALLDSQNQTYSIPYAKQIGTVETNFPAQYAAILETPPQEGVYNMQWTITSEKTAYAFTIRVNVFA